MKGSILNICALILPVFLLTVCSINEIDAQSDYECSKTRSVCSKALAPFISDGQFRSANLEKGESQLFKTTFYGGRTYKLTLGANGSLGNVRFKILNSYKKVLFDSAKQGYPKEWKLKFKNTSDFYLDISLAEGVEKGCALVLVGFEN